MATSNKKLVGIFNSVNTSTFVEVFFVLGFCSFLHIFVVCIYMIPLMWYHAGLLSLYMCVCMGQERITIKTRYNDYKKENNGSLHNHQTSIYCRIKLHYKDFLIIFPYTHISVDQIKYLYNQIICYFFPCLYKNCKSPLYLLFPHYYHHIKIPGNSTVMLWIKWLQLPLQVCLVFDNTLVYKSCVFLYCFCIKSNLVLKSICRSMSYYLDGCLYI